MFHIVANWVPYYLNEVQEWICNLMCYIILEMTSSTFNPTNTKFEKVCHLCSWW